MRGTIYSPEVFSMVNLLNITWVEEVPISIPTLNIFSFMCTVSLCLFSLALNMLNCNSIIGQVNVLNKLNKLLYSLSCVCACFNYLSRS